MKKKFVALFALIVGVAVFLGGCVNSGISINSVQGTGAMVTRSIDVDDFNGIEVGGSFNIVYRQAEETALTVVLHENLFEYLDVNTRGSNLHVGFSRGISITDGNHPRLYVYAPYLRTAGFSGAVDAVDWDVIEGDSFRVNASGAVNIDIEVIAARVEIDVSGAVNIALELTTEELDLSASGAADVVLSGSADVIDVQGSGAFNLEGGDLLIGGGSIDVSGASDVVLSSLANVDISVSGAARVRGAD